MVAAIPPALADPSADGRLQPRINNGVPASIADLPAVVFIENRDNGGACTGAIVAPRWVLTAANCFDQPLTEHSPNPPELLVLVGRETFSNPATDWPEVHLVQAGIHHPLWHPTGDAAAHDLALLQRPTPTSIPPMALTAAGRPDRVGRQATVTGWDTTQDNPTVDTKVLRRSTVDVRPRTDCETKWG